MTLVLLLAQNLTVTLPALFHVNASRPCQLPLVRVCFFFFITAKFNQWRLRLPNPSGCAIVSLLSTLRNVKAAGHVPCQLGSCVDPD